MDSQYGRIYKQLYDRLSQYPYELPEPPQLASLLPLAPLQDQIHKAIERAGARARDQGFELRDDAKFFLFVNLLEMISVPIILRGDSSRYLPDGLDVDVDVLVKAAAARAPDRQVSAHSIVDALASNWQNLRLAAVGLWGSEPQFEE